MAKKATKTLFKRDFLYTLYSWGYYAAIFASFLVSSFILKNFVDGIREEDILVSAYPLHQPLYITLVIISIYLVIVSAISISREREQGTLEVLFYGPVTAGNFLWSKYFKDLLLGIIALGFTAVYFYLVSYFTNLGFTIGLIKALFMGIFLISCVVSFGLFISSLTGRIRSSVITLLAILGAFLAIQLAYGALLGLGEEATISLPLLYLRQTLSYIFQGINWISPFAFLSRGLDAVVLESWSLYLANIAYCLIYSLIFIVLSIFTMNRRGVKA
ncbi:MAG TPA: ABC transporter permease subunit [Candidatus Atribacteria bacterium]|nr:ABC transporter permease subunit [Candidatus Atribacteria bacterium]